MEREDSDIVSSVVTVATAIVGLAMIATLISKNADDTKASRATFDYAAARTRGAASFAKYQAERKAAARTQAEAERATRSKKHPQPFAQPITIREAIRERAAELGLADRPI